MPNPLERAMCWDFEGTGPGFKRECFKKTRIYACDSGQNRTWARLEKWKGHVEGAPSCLECQLHLSKIGLPCIHHRQR